MKYIKKFEKQKISQEERDLTNLARRIQYNLNKYLGIKSRRDIGFIYVDPCFWCNDENDTISVSLREHPQYYNKNYTNVIQYIRDKKIKPNSMYGYGLSKQQAEDFLTQIKVGFIYNDAEKYNL